MKNLKFYMILYQRISMTFSTKKKPDYSTYFKKLICFMIGESMVGKN